MIKYLKNIFELISGNKIIIKYVKFNKLMKIKIDF
jgi:hypothetical protein